MICDWNGEGGVIGRWWLLIALIDDHHSLEAGLRYRRMLTGRPQTMFRTGLVIKAQSRRISGERNVFHSRMSLFEAMPTFQSVLLVTPSVSKPYEINVPKIANVARRIR